MVDEVAGWLAGSPRFRGFAEAHHDKIRKKLKTGTPEPLRRWASVATPPLVIDGGDSKEWMHNATGALAQVLPNATRRTNGVSKGRDVSRSAARDRPEPRLDGLAGGFAGGRPGRLHDRR
jgi:hypothetical protein